MYGVRINMDRVKRYKYYWGADFLWAKGTLHGNGTGSRLKSTLTDENIEARFGYTFGAKRWRCASITPFVGLGYFIEKNHYEHPSPLKVHFKNTFGYVPVGFLSQVFIFPNLSVGCNFKVRFLFDAINKVSNDPDYKSFYQNYEQKLQYRVEIPIDYFFTYLDKPFGISLAPFYEYRSYGHSVNFPFDFPERL